MDFSTQEDFDKAKANEDTDNALASTIPGTVEDWIREQDMKREKGEIVCLCILNRFFLQYNIYRKN